MNQEPGKENGSGEVEQAEMVAYLDGELDVEQVAAVEQRLAADSQYRLRLQQLQQAWDLLDELPRRRADDKFTRSTVEIIVLKARDEADQRAATASWRKWLPTAAGLLLLLAVPLAAYFGSMYVVTKENRQLVRDLPVIEKVNEYRQSESIDFLRMLVKEGLFDTENGHGR